MARRRTVKRELLRVIVGLVFAAAAALVAYYGLLAAAHKLTAK